VTSESEHTAVLLFSLYGETAVCMTF